MSKFERDISKILGGPFFLGHPLNTNTVSVYELKICIRVNFRFLIRTLYVRFCFSFHKKTIRAVLLNTTSPNVLNPASRFYSNSIHLFQLQRIFGGTNGSHANADGTPHHSSSDGTHIQTVTEEITVGPQANFTLLDQMTEIKKNQRKQKIFILRFNSNL